MSHPATRTSSSRPARPALWLALVALVWLGTVGPAAARGPVDGAPERFGTSRPVGMTYPRALTPAPGVAAPGPVRVIPRLSPHPAPPATTGVAAPAGSINDSPGPAPATVVASFEGMDRAVNPVSLEPPDPILAMGPAHVVEFQNVSGRIYTRAGATVSTFTLSAFFQVPAGVDLTSDPQILYDALSGRFFGAFIGLDSSTNLGYEFLAVSQTSDPTLGWWIYQETDSNLLPDFPGLGISDDKVGLSANAFAWPSRLYAGAQLRVWDKAALLQGANGTWALFAPNLSYFTIRPARSQSPTTTLYTATLPNTLNPTALIIQTVTGTPALGTLARADTSLSITGVSIPPAAKQPGGGSIDSGDERLLNAVWQNQRLWLTSTTRCSFTGDTADRSCLQLFEIDTTTAPSLRQDFTYGSAGFYYYYPALTLNAAGDVYLVFGRSNSTEPAGIRYTGQLAGVPGLRSSALLKAGVGAYVGGRWGDYFGAATDPMNPNCAWVNGEYAKGAGTGLWGTFIGQLALSGGCSADAVAISGTIRDSGGNPVPGVTVSAGTASLAITDAGGTYSILAPAAGSVTVAPSRANYGFSPRSRTVTAPPGASGQDFIAAPVHATTWYFAEGYTAAGFDEYLTILNPNPSAADVTVTYLFTGASPLQKHYTAPATARTTIKVNDEVGPNQAVSMLVESSQSIVAERPMYFSYGPDGWTGGDVAVGTTAPSLTWYFAEGYTGAGFDEYLTLQNPNPSPTTATVTYLLGAGSPIVKTHPLPALSRQTIKVNDEVGPNQAVSMKVESILPVVAERPMYFSYGPSAWTGGHDAVGVTAPAPTWYFAEGYTGTGFDEYLTLQNPNPAVVTAIVTYMLTGATSLTKTYVLPAASRQTFKVNDEAGPNQAVSMQVEATQPVVAERPMYFSYGPAGWTGGHVDRGANAPATGWYFAEGYTGSGFDEYLTLQNPGAAAALATVSYLGNSGASVVESYLVPATSRLTVKVNDRVGAGQAVSMQVLSTQPVVAERPMYFDYGPAHWTGGHVSPGFAP